MRISKTVGSKTYLLDWINSILKHQGITINKIQQLGTGVGYLLLLDYVHPGSLMGIKIIKKPSNQYQYQLNLKLLASAFMKLGINKDVEIDKLSKMKMQDNIAFLQWFYNYAQQLSANIDEKYQIKKLKLKIPQKIKMIQLSKLKKKDTQQNEQNNLKIKISSQQKLKLIHNIIHNQQINNNTKKINKIKQILHLQHQFLSSKNILSDIYHHDQDILINQQTRISNHLQFQKQQQLQNLYFVYQNNCLRKKQNQIPIYQSIKIQNKKQQNQFIQHQPIQLNPLNLTDNSILLQSDKKSIHSQNLLNDQ